MSQTPAPKPAPPAPRDYRDSHRIPGKGQSYHAMFTENRYRRLIWELEKRILDRVLAEEFGDKAIDHLDFACGTGRVLGHIAARARLSVGVDVSPSMLAVARESAGRSEIYEADLTEDDILGTRRFDLITAFRFFPNAQASLRTEAIRVLVKHLAPDGRLVYNDHKNTASLKYRLARLRGRGGFDGMSLAEALGLAAENGLEIVRSFAIGFTPDTEEHMITPAFLLRIVETVLSRCRPLKSWGEDVIFVCRPSLGH